MKKYAVVFIIILLALSILAGCNMKPIDVPSEMPEATPAATLQSKAPAETPESTATQEASYSLSAIAYEYLQYIDSSLPDRDCIGGKNYVQAQQWIIDELKNAGYNESDIHKDDFIFRNGSDRITAQNISVTIKGTGGKQIIIGAHYDGTGTGDNGSGAALTLAAATRFANVETYYDLTFVFFSGEEYGCHGSDAYTAAMTEEDINSTQYMINIDTIIAGDYCHIYGGIADIENKTVVRREAYDNALAAANALGLDIRSNPWTFDNPEPSAKEGMPSYPSPSTGDWGDHAAFSRIGIPYVYFEATNWEIGKYNGYEETETFGPIMNTKNDNLGKIESLFPGRAEDHMNTFAALLEALLQQRAF